LSRFRAGSVGVDVRMCDVVEGKSECISLAHASATGVSTSNAESIVVICILYWMAKNKPRDEKFREVELGMMTFQIS